MSKVKNISGGPLDVPLLDRQVEDGEVVDVPDFQPGHTDADPLPIIWPENRWEPVTTTSSDVAVVALAAVTEPGPPEDSPVADVADVADTSGEAAI